MGEPRIAFVSREVYPFDSAGLGNYVTFTAAALASQAEVTIVTSDIHAPRFEELRGADDPRLPANVRFEFVPEPTHGDAGGWYGQLHVWGARVFEALCRLYPGGGPDLAEIPDYLGEGCVTAQAARTSDPRIRNTLVCVRAYTTSEICSVLDGYLDRQRESQLLHDLERYALRHADRFLHPGGDVLATYRRFYGPDAIAPAEQVPHTIPPGDGARPAPDGDSKLRLLYVGRLERRKGVQNLIRAATAVPGFDWSLTLVGGDTPTAPLGLPMGSQLELMIAGDERIRIAGKMSREELEEAVSGSHVCVSPSLWECWPNTVLESLAQNRPVIATPVGGQVEMVEHDRSGWLFPGTGAADLATGLERLIADRERVEATIASGAPRAAFERLADPEPVRERYRELCATKPRRSRAALAREPDPALPPLVSVVVPYFRMHAHVAETIESIFAQTHRRLEVIVVNDGSFEPADHVLVELAERYPIDVLAQVNCGLGQARNTGIAQSRGTYVLPVDPDDVLLPKFVTRCVEVMEASPELAYVTTWTRYIDERGQPIDGGYRPLGNTAGYIAKENVAGSAMALLRRSLFTGGYRYSADLTSYEDWLLYLDLAAAGLEGHVIPEPLALYRVRRRSMLRGVTEPKLKRLHGELAALSREREVEWTSSSV